MTTGLPTSGEINIHNTLDERWAQKNFLGKTLEDAEGMFRRNSLHYLDDLHAMGPQAFCFYVPAAIRFIQSDDTTGDPTTISYFHMVLEWRVRNERAAIIEVVPLLRDVVSHILDQWERFDVDTATFGDLKERYVALLEQLGDTPR